MRLCVSILILFLMANVVLGQASSLSVRVVDQTSAIIPNVILQLKSREKTIKKIENKEAEEISISNLQTGLYEVYIEAAGFKPQTSVIDVKAGHNRLTVTLEIIEIQESVEVKQDLQTESLDNSFSNFLNLEQIEALPDDPEELEEELKRIAGGDDVIIRVDGFSGGNLLQKSQIASIRIVRSSFDAENHELGYTYVDVATKPGDQKFSGSLSFNFNDESLNSRNAFSPSRFPEQRRNTVFFLSGPIKKNKSSFTISALDFRNFNTNLINANLPTGIFRDATDSKSHFTSLNSTLNQNLSQYHNAKFSYQFSNTDSQDLGVGGFDLPERAFDNKTLSHEFRFSESGYVGKKYLNEIRFQLTKENIKTIPRSEEVGIMVLDSFNAGGAGNFRKEDTIRGWIADNLLFGYKNHALKIGASFSFEKRKEEIETNSNGTFIFSSLEDYQMLQPSLFSQSPIDRYTDVSQIQFGAFVQDDLRIRRNLNLSFGLRYEIQSNLKDYNNFSPRLGFTWSPLETGKLTFRGGAGVFYNWLRANDIATIRSNDILQPPNLVVINPNFPDPFTGGSSQILPQSYWQVASDLKNPYIVLASIGSESRINENFTVRVNYTYQKGIHQFRSRNINAPIMNSRPDSTFGNIINIESSGSFSKNSLIAGFESRLSRKLFLSVQYQLSKASSDGEGIFRLPTDNYNLRQDIAATDDDQRHRFSTSTTWEIRKGLRLTGRYTLNSPRPYTITTGKDDNGDTNFNDRPINVERNSVRGSWQNSLDMSLSYAFSFIDKKGSDNGKSFGVMTTSSEVATGFDPTESDKRFSLKFYATAKNLLNHTNFDRYVGVQTSEFFCQPVSASNQRRIELGLRFAF
ncbi:MAG: TonB-dependent receptor domain-containing protein [Pyrinomonadaceae bacterium]